MFRSTRTLRRFTIGALSAAALAGAFGVGAVVAQQQTAATKVTALMKQAISEYPGHEVTMLTLDIPPGGGSPPHRHPGHHIFGYVLEGAYAIKLDDGPERTLTKGGNFLRSAGPASRGLAQRQRNHTGQGSCRHSRGIRQADNGTGTSVARLRAAPNVAGKVSKEAPRLFRAQNGHVLRRQKPRRRTAGASPKKGPGIQPGPSSVGSSS